MKSVLEHDVVQPSWKSLGAFMFVHSSIADAGLDMIRDEGKVSFDADPVPPGGGFSRPSYRVELDYGIITIYENYMLIQKKSDSRSPRIS